MLLKFCYYCHDFSVIIQQNVNKKKQNKKKQPSKETFVNAQQETTDVKPCSTDVVVAEQPSSGKGNNC